VSAGVIDRCIHCPQITRRAAANKLLLLLLLLPQIIDNNCIPVLINAICNSTAEQEARVRPFVPVLLGAAQRCANFQPPPAIECPDGRVIPVALASTAGAGAPAAEAPMPEAAMPMMAAAPPAAVPAGNASGNATA
jgi:hypothetical protein